MYKWSVKMTLKNGVIMTGIIKCECKSSNDLAEMILKREINSDAHFFGFLSDDENGALFVNLLDVAAVEFRTI